MLIADLFMIAYIGIHPFVSKIMLQFFLLKLL